MSGRNILGSQRAHDVLTCRLCTQYLRDPRQLPCGHSFCLSCLQRYYAAECQRSETGRLRSPSVERRRRGLLPCPAAPVCLHVAVVPDDGVSGFPVNQKIADIKEHVVNEMAYNISMRIGRPQSARVESDTASVRSDETDFSDVSCETTRSAPAASSADNHSGRSPFPNLAKYAKYFETDKDGNSGTSAKYAPNIRFDRRRVAISSSFQHRRRRVPTPSPAAFDDSTPCRPSRAESAPHLDSDEISYRPTVRPRQGSSMASPLLRRARPASCILEELTDDHDFLNRVGKTTSPTETPLRATATDHQHQASFRERVLPTHRENISMDEDRTFMPAQSKPANYDRRQSEDMKTGSTSTKTMRNHDESSWYSGSHSEKLGTSNKATDTKSVPSHIDSQRQQKYQTDDFETGSTSSKSNTSRVHSVLNKHGKHYSNKLETDTISGKRTGTHVEGARNGKPQSDELITDKNSAPVSSRLGRRVLPRVPTDYIAAETSGSVGHYDDVHHPTSSLRTHHTQQLPRTDKQQAMEHHCASNLGHQQKDPHVSESSSADASVPNKQKPCTSSRLDHNKSRSTQTNFSDIKSQKTRDSRLSSDAGRSRPAVSASVKSSSDSVQTKSSVSVKPRGVDRSKSSVSQTQSSTRDSSVPDKSQDTRFTAHSNTSQFKSKVSSGKANGTEQVQSLQHGGGTSPVTRGCAMSPESSGNDRQSKASSSTQHKERQSRRSTGSEKSPTDKSRSSKSTPGSGSRLTYKVNAATIQPVLMNTKKTKQGCLNAERRSSAETAAGTDADECHQDSMSKLMEPTETIELNEQHSDVAGHSNVSQSSSSTASANSNVSSENKLSSDGSHPGVDKECDCGPSGRHDPTVSVPRSPQSLHTNVSSETADDTGSSKCHINDDCRADDDDDDDATNGNKDDSNSKNQQQWNQFMATLQATRAKYSSTDNRSTTSESSHSLPVYDDSMTLCWRIQRDDFAVPTSIAITADGSAVIADVANCLLDFTDTDGNIVHSVTGTKPFSVAINGNDLIYVGDRRSRTVRVFDIYGSDVAQWDSECTSFGWIAGIAMLRNGQLAILDRERCKVS